MIRETEVRPIYGLWESLYPGETAVRDRLLNWLLDNRMGQTTGPRQSFDTGGLVYCTYGDAFGHGLDGMSTQIPRLASMGIRTLWLLPVLASPGHDQGFDISDYTLIDSRFGGNAAFARLVNACRTQEIQVIFDIAINHCSEEHPWFQAAVADRNSAWRDWFHWSDNDLRYPEAALNFQGMVNSNWTWNERAGQYYLHRFYPFQPDLNYANPAVTEAMIHILANWRRSGVDGFRMDAAAMLWKRDGTICENLPETHLVLKLFRACLDMIRPGTLFLAEANQEPAVTMVYFGDGDECQAAYQFPLMPRFWQAIMQEDPGLLVTAEFPALPPGCAWFTFLRCHDELTLDLVPPADRPALIAAFCRNPAWAFRDGQAFSGRLFELLDRNPEKTILAFSLLFSLPGTPIIYYGDEIAMVHNNDYYEQKTQATGFADSRYFHRGPFDHARAAEATRNPASPAGRVLKGLMAILELRRDNPALAAAVPALSAVGPILVSQRRAHGRRLIAWNNLSGHRVQMADRTLEPWAVAWQLD